MFLYHRDLSTSVSFVSDTTRNADTFMREMISPLFQPTKGETNQMVLIASDGEVYGHHKAFRDKFLSHLLNGALHTQSINLTYPGLWLRDNSPELFVDLVEFTSWSCMHGITRWMGECECSPGANWKTVLRLGLEKSLRMSIMNTKPCKCIHTTGLGTSKRVYCCFLGQLSLPELLGRYIQKPLTDDDIIKIGMLLAAQFERQRIFTSCGWFFEHFHRIEPQNNIAYAAQAVWLTEKVTGRELKAKSMACLKKVKDERTGLRGDTVFAERYQRIQDFSEENVSYFNPSSSFST